MALPATLTPFLVTKPMLPHLVGKTVQVMDETSEVEPDSLEMDANKAETKTKRKKSVGLLGRGRVFVRFWCGGWSGRVSGRLGVS